MKILLTDAFRSIWDNGWHFQAHIGPFNSPEEAEEFARKIAAIDPKDPTSPPLNIVIKDTNPNGEQFP